MRIDPDLALTVAAVLDEGTLDAAARRLHVTPSAVSQRVKALEEQVGQRLLVRSKPARPTAAGRVVAQFGRQVAAAEHDTAATLGLTTDGAWARIAVAVNADSLGAWLLDPLVRFADRHPVELDLHREDQDRTARLLEDGTVVAALTSRSEPVPGCRVDALGTMRFVAMAAPSWWRRWAPDGITTTVLESAPRIDYDRDDRLQRDWLVHHSVDPHRAPRHLVPSTHDITRAVLRGLGWALVPAQQAEPLVERDELRALGSPEVTTELFWQSWKDHSDLLSALTEEVVVEARRRLSDAGARRPARRPRQD